MSNNAKILARESADREGTLLPSEWEMAGKIIQSAGENEIILPSPPDNWLAVLGDSEEK